MDRRSFLAQSMRAAVLSGAMAELLTSGQSALAAIDDSYNGAEDDQHHLFWDSFFDSVDPGKTHVVLRDTPQAIPQHVDPGKIPHFFHYADSMGFRRAENIQQTELPKLQGAALISMSISGFHASDADGKRIGEVSSSQLQLHAVQTAPIAQYIAPMAWASLASVFHDKNGKLPTVEQLNFMAEDNSGASASVQRVLYPKAEGKLAVNVTLPQKNALLHRIIQDSLKGAAIAAPLLSLPAISVPAIRAFTSFYNMLQQNAGFLINSPLKDAVASYDAIDSGNMHADALKLIDGQYVIVPSSASDGLSKQLSDYKMVSGYLVPKTFGGTDDYQEAAKASLREVTYVTLKINVAQAIDVITAETPNGKLPQASTPTPDCPASPAKKKK